MEIRDRNGYNKEVGRKVIKEDGSVELFDKKGYNIGSVSEAKYMQMLLREVDKNYESHTTTPWIDE